MLPSDAPADPSRRDLLRTGLFGAIALSAVSTGAVLSGCSAPTAAPGLRVLRQSDVVVLTALVPVVMAGVVAGGRDGAAQVAATVRELDAFLSTTSRPGQKQLLQLFDLLSMPLTRYTVAGLSDDWPHARPAAIEAFLLRWRDSRFELLRGGYAALSQLLAMSWYLQPEHQAALGYQAPRVVQEVAA